VTVSNSGTETLSAAVLKLTARQGRAGKAIVSRRIKLKSIEPGKSIRKNIAIRLSASKLKRGKRNLKIKLQLTNQGKTLAAKTGTTRLDFGQAKIRRPRDVSDT
jgi:hypothetical protein